MTESWEAFRCFVPLSFLLFTFYPVKTGPSLFSNPQQLTMFPKTVPSAPFKTEHCPLAFYFSGLGISLEGIRLTPDNAAIVLDKNVSISSSSSSSSSTTTRKKCRWSSDEAPQMTAYRKQSSSPPSMPKRRTETRQGDGRIASKEEEAPRKPKRSKEIQISRAA
jgi:hypothetical protein